MPAAAPAVMQQEATALLVDDSRYQARLLML